MAGSRCCWRLVVVVSVSFTLLAYICCGHLWFLIAFVGVLSSLSASHSHCYIVHGGSVVPPRGGFLRIFRLVVGVVISALSSLLAMHSSFRRRRPFSWLILSATAPCRCCRRRRLVVVAVLSLSSAASFLVASYIGGISFFLSSLASRSRCCQKRLVVVVGGVGAFSEKLILY